MLTHYLLLTDFLLLKFLYFTLVLVRIELIPGPLDCKCRMQYAMINSVLCQSSSKVKECFYCSLNLFMEF